VVATLEFIPLVETLRNMFFPCTIATKLPVFWYWFSEPIGDKIHRHFSLAFVAIPGCLTKRIQVKLCQFKYPKAKKSMNYTIVKVHGDIMLIDHVLKYQVSGVTKKTHVLPMDNMDDIVDELQFFYASIGRLCMVGCLCCFRKC
jgi:hypothetical protein